MRVATNSGPFTVAVADGNSILSGSGTYRLTVSGNSAPPPIGCSLSPPQETNFVGMVHMLSATVRTNTGPIACIAVDFDVIAGPNMGQSGAFLTSTNGKATFSYSGSGGAGADTIRATGAVAGQAFTCTASVAWILYPPGDVNADLHVTGQDSLLINQVLVGLRATNHAVFATAGFANGDVNRPNAVTGADSLLINQTMVGLRAHLTTRILPGSRDSGLTNAVTVFGVGFPSNVTSVTISPLNLTLTNVVVVSREQITALVLAGGLSGTGTVQVTSSSTNGMLSFGRFTNR
jgi:hypothetical protein